jgi:thioredoxin-dependent peroxiredoxin
MSDVRSGAVKFKGSPIDLAGKELKVGDAAPDFELVDTGLATVTRQNYAGKTLLLIAVPSLDTSTCSLETKKFNEQVAGRSDLVAAVVSMDLPFAQKRWCGAEGVENVVALSDFRKGKFASDYGVKIAGGPLEGIMARAVFVVKPDGKLAHVEYVSEVSAEPDYSAALAATK